MCQSVCVMFDRFDVTCGYHAFDLANRHQQNAELKPNFSLIYLLYVGTASRILLSKFLLEIAA